MDATTFGKGPLERFVPYGDERKVIVRHHYTPMLEVAADPFVPLVHLRALGGRTSASASRNGA